MLCVQEFSAAAYLEYTVLQHSTISYALVFFLPLLLLCSLSLGSVDGPLLIEHLIVLTLIPCLDVSLIISCIPWNTERTNALLPKKGEDTAEIVGTKQLLSP